MADPTIIGRDRELEEIGKLLEPRPSGSRVLLLEGEAGTGKTTLMQAALDEARARGYRVLTSTPARSEMQLSTSALRDLLDSAFAEVAHELPPPQRHALAAVLLREDPGQSPPQPDVIAVALLSALRALATLHTTVVAIDDVQWLDAASAATLSYVIRRLDQEPVTLLLARRIEDAPELPLELDRVASERLEVMRLTALSIGALGRILRERVGVSYPRTTLRRLHEVSRGNPFFAIELARALGDAAGPLRPGEPLPVPATLRELVQERIAALPPAVLDALTVASALLRPSLALIAAALGVDALPLLERAIEQHIATVDGENVRFAHPLFASAIYGRLSQSRRRQIHRQLAGLVVDIEERARHLALAADLPDAEIARVLEEGARAAFSRGGPAAAAELAGEARRLTPSEAPDAAWRRAFAEADYHFASGDTARASALLDELASRASTSAERARALSRQARVRHFERDIGSSVALLYEALAEANGDIGLRAEIEEGLAWGLLLIRRNLAGAVEHARAAARFAEDRGDRAALSEALAVQGLTEFVLGRDWRHTMARALSLEEATLGLRALRHPSFAQGYCLTCSDDVDGARAIFQELMRRAADHGDESSPPSLLNHLTMVEFLAGDWPAAAAHAADGYARAVESGQQPTEASILGRRALIEARRGALAEARATALRSLAVAVAGAFDPSRPEQAMVRGGEAAIWALGSVELWLGRPKEAHRWLGPLCDALLAAGIEEPGELRGLPDDVEALIALGLVEEAEGRIDRLEAWAGRVARPSVSGAAGRCRGLLLAARGEEAAALAALERAASSEERSPLPFERARTLLALGAQQRRLRQRTAARETLRRAEAIYEQIGSAIGLQKTRAELSRIGGRRAFGDALTPTERQIAQLVAEGKKNREVAAALVVTERTVEAALTLIYRKLDVRSRTELARKLARAD
jgi:DNA-binding NarL/FixJ family response regulator/KaiC/GvpD/RAD55 family RecA-like ATPase